MEKIYDISEKPVPMNERVLLLQVSGPMDEVDEDGFIIQKNVYDKNWVVGHQDQLFGLITFPFTNSIPKNVKFTHWTHLPKIP